MFDLSNSNNVVRLVGMALPSVSDIHFGNNSLVRLPSGLVMNGTSADDVLAGGASGDMLIGGKGQRYLHCQPHRRSAGGTAGGNEGTDLVKTTLASYTLGAYVEKLSFSGSGNFSGTGNNLNNTMTGGAGGDWLNGGTGNDVLTGGETGATPTGSPAAASKTPSTTAIPEAPTGCCLALASPTINCSSRRATATCW